MECVTVENCPVEVPDCYESEHLTTADLRDIEFRERNLHAVKQIQRIILAQEDRAMSMDETLNRVIEYYRRAVPF